MKKSIYLTIKDALTNFGYDNKEVMDALNAEINKGEDAKAKNAEAYESIHSLIVDSLPDNGSFVTCTELWEAIEKNVPSGITKGKVQYALTHLWQDEIVKMPGKPNTYRRA